MQAHRTTSHRDGTPPAASAAERQFPEVTPEQVAYYMDRGRRLRSIYAWWMLRRLRHRVRDALKPPKRQPKPVETDNGAALDAFAEQLRTPLTSIRSSAEILRQHPDIKTHERARFLDIVLAEEARLESLLTQIMDASDVNRRAGVLQVRLDDVRMENR